MTVRKCARSLGFEGKITSEVTTGKPDKPWQFKPGRPRPARAGRRRGTPNKLKAELVVLLKKHGAAPDDPLEFLRWVQHHPQASLMLRADAAYKRAKFMYAQKSESRVEMTLDAAEVRQRLNAGRERIAQASAVETISSN